MSKVIMYGGADKEAAELKEKICNLADSIKPCDKTYYVSQNGQDDGNGSIESPFSLYSFIDICKEIEEGSVVLFERGSVFRTNRYIKVVSGVSYGAYGEGEKPAIYGSLKNYAQKELWQEQMTDDIWVLDYPVPNIRDEVGTIVFDDGELVGCQKTKTEDLKLNGDFYHDTKNGKLYVFYEKACPADIYESIEISGGFGLVGISFTNNVLIENLCFKYCGAHAIGGSETEKITVRGCEFDWIGGMHQNAEERFGNGIEFYAGAKDILVENCYLKQIYDAALTFQMTGASEFENITFRNNLVEYTPYSIEFFNYDGNGKTGSYKNIYLEDNILRFSGYGWGSAALQRKWWVAVAAINGWRTANPDTENFVIRNNILDVSLCNLVFWCWQDGDVQPGVIAYGNSYYQMKTPEWAYDFPAVWKDSSICFGDETNKRHYAQNQEELEKAVAAFDSNPNIIKWLE